MKHLRIDWLIYNVKVLRKVCGLIWGHYLVTVGKNTKLRNLSLVILLGLELILMIVLNAIPTGVLKLPFAFAVFGVAYFGLFTLIADAIYDEAIQNITDRKTFKRRLDEIINPSQPAVVTPDQPSPTEE